MDRLVRPFFLVLVGCLGLGALTGLAWGEVDDSGGEVQDPNIKRILVLPFRGPRGIGVRDEVAKRLDPQAVVKTIGNKAAKRPVKAARRHKADLMVGGRIRCPNQNCVVKVLIYRPSGKIWRKRVVRARRPQLPEKIADAAEEVLNEMEMLYEPPPEPEPEPEVEEWEEEEFAEDLVDDEPPDEPRRVGDRYKAVEVYLSGDLTVARNLCLDVRDGANNSECDINDPALDDRTFTVTPFGSLGLRAVVFPTAFREEQSWHSHLGIYFDYNHSLVISSRRRYRYTDGTEFDQEIRTTQQDLRLGIIGRIPFGSPSRPQLRLFSGFGMYQFALDDEDYPADTNPDDPNQVLPDVYRNSNPYLPTFTYLSVDVGLEFRMPLIGMLWPYTSFAYRAALGLGQAADIFAQDTTSHGFDWELGLIVELGLGIRLAAAFNLLYYTSTYEGEVDWSTRDPNDIWAGTESGEFSKDMVLRLRFFAGWSF